MFRLNHRAKLKPRDYSDSQKPYEHKKPHSLARRTVRLKGAAAHWLGEGTFHIVDWWDRVKDSRLVG